MISGRKSIEKLLRFCSQSVMIVVFSTFPLSLSVY